jgi:hypothetical protein
VAGTAGATGARGATGLTGATGSTELAGVTGPTGAAGAAGPQGAIGLTGQQGPIGSIGAQGQLAADSSWSLYRNYTFNSSSDEIAISDSNKARETSSYMHENPTYQVGIDGMNGDRVKSVRDALIGAGVPAEKIHSGPFGDPQYRRQDMVAVMVSSN